MGREEHYQNKGQGGPDLIEKAIAEEEAANTSPDDDHEPTEAEKDQAASDKYYGPGGVWTPS